MVLTESQQKEFEEASRPLVRWLNDNCHPHVTVVANCTNVELMEGINIFCTDDYLKDKPLCPPSAWTA